MTFEEFIARFTASPTGRQMLSGDFVITYTDDNPASAYISPPEGTIVLWDDSGTMKLMAYTREYGWVGTTLT